MSDAESAAGTVETRAEFNEEFVKNWLTAINMAGDEEKDWREDAKNTLERYRSEKNRSKNFNILYANTQTTCPALYNSEPSPDVRRRFGDDDESGEALATMLERGLSIQGELYDLDNCLKAAVKDRQLQGRGITRVRLVKGNSGSSHLECEPVIWDDFRRGPAKLWKDVPWEAFRWKYTRDELVELNPKVGKDVTLDCVVGSVDKDKDGAELPDLFKRATVWEIWDRQERKVYFIAESYKDAPLNVVSDPYKLRDFFPNPRPLYAVETTDNLIPVCEFMIWKSLADEVDAHTSRISGIVKTMKHRGLYDGALEDAVKKMAGLDDGELAPTQDAARVMQQGTIEKAVWLWPVEKAIEVVKGLYEAREQAKQTIYEITGVADILRGSTEASETATAQQIKAQWGSLRLQDGQRDVQRYARDLYRIMGDLMLMMSPAEITAMTGVPFRPELPPNATPEDIAKAAKIEEGTLKLLKGEDLHREFAIEIETDSTIRADLARQQQNVSGFVMGFGEFINSVGPAVEAGYMPPEVAVGLLQTFARNFKLGREAETIMDEWKKILEEKAKQPPAPPPPDPKLEAVKAKAEVDIQKAQLDAQAKQAEHGMKMQQMQAQGALAQQKHGLEVEKLGAEAQAQQVEAGIQQQQAQADVAVAHQQHELKREELAMNQQVSQEAHGQKLQVMQEQTKAKVAQAKAKPKPKGGKK